MIDRSTHARRAKLAGSAGCGVAVRVSNVNIRCDRLQALCVTNAKCCSSSMIQQPRFLELALFQPATQWCQRQSTVPRVDAIARGRSPFCADSGTAGVTSSGKPESVRRGFIVLACQTGLLGEQWPPVARHRSKTKAARHCPFGFAKPTRRRFRRPSNCAGVRSQHVRDRAKTDHRLSGHRGSVQKAHPHLPGADPHGAVRSARSAGRADQLVAISRMRS